MWYYLYKIHKPAKGIYGNRNQNSGYLEWHWLGRGHKGAANVLCHVLGGDCTGINICRSLLSCILKMAMLIVSKLHLSRKISSKILLYKNMSLSFHLYLYLYLYLHLYQMAGWRKWGKVGEDIMGGGNCMYIADLEYWKNWYKAIRLVITCWAQQKRWEKWKKKKLGRVGRGLIGKRASQDINHQCSLYGPGTWQRQLRRPAQGLALSISGRKERLVFCLLKANRKEENGDWQYMWMRVLPGWGYVLNVVCSDGGTTGSI